MHLFYFHTNYPFLYANFTMTKQKFKSFPSAEGSLNTQETRDATAAQSVVDLIKTLQEWRTKLRLDDTSKRDGLCARTQKHWQFTLVFCTHM